MCIIMREIRRFIKIKLFMVLMMICIGTLTLELLFILLVEMLEMRKGIMILLQRLLKIGASGSLTIMGMGGSLYSIRLICSSSNTAL